MSGATVQAVDEIHRRVGRNLLRFQGIEECLRFMIPYMGGKLRPRTVEDVRTAQQQVRNLPLGDLIKAFKLAATQIDANWLDELQNLLDARNELVHKFYRNPLFNLLSGEGVSNALAYLDEQHRAIEEWSEILRNQAVVMLIAVIDSNPLLATEYAHHRQRLVASFPPSMEFVDLVQPERTQWASTRIVNLLRLAETKTEPVDGMTLLSRAGKLIASVAPDLHLVNDYGLRSLKEVLSRSGLFEVRVAADGITVSYRSARQLTDPPLDEDSTRLTFRVTRRA